MDEEDEGAGISYAQVILGKWIEISECGEQFRSNLLSGDHDPKVAYEFISKMGSLWSELLPKVKGRKLSRDGMETEYQTFEKYSYDPIQLLGSEEEDDKPDTQQQSQIFKMQQILREVLEELGITKW